MKHLLRAMGAAMLAALLLSACSTPQEQTEPSAPQATQSTQAATGATEESATEAEELLALPRDLGSGLTLQAVLPFSGPNVDADGTVAALSERLWQMQAWRNCRKTGSPLVSI